jgi:antitoxin component HigA of HigAB toxin-antitoxin module
MARPDFQCAVPQPPSVDRGEQRIVASQHYDWAIREITRYFEAEPAPGTADGDRFEVLSILIKDYEDKHFTMPAAST